MDQSFRIAIGSISRMTECVFQLLIAVKDKVRIVLIMRITTNITVPVHPSEEGYTLKEDYFIPLE